jgi:hypothetical protein
VRKGGKEGEKEREREREREKEKERRIGSHNFEIASPKSAG